MDIQLPGMSGIEAMHKLKDNENTKNIPIVAMSANSLKRGARAGVAAGFDDHISKPFLIPRFLAKMDYFFKKPKK